MEAPEGKERPEGPPEGGGEPTRELTAAGGQFLLRADVVEFRRGDLLGGRYQIEKAIGRGATGSVLQAFDRVVRSVVAVKILRHDLATDERWIERLGGELRYARKLQHPNVCRVFDMGEADGHHFLTMEFAGAGSLRQRLVDVPNRTWEERIADARSVIEGLVAIHAANIVHRDVKPENVLVMEDGRLVVSDFGVAVSAGHTTYFSSKVAGTPSYMAPEVIMGDKATPRADVFSLGIVLHEILFGKRPDWQMTPKGRVIKPVVGKKASTREKAFARLCGECLNEFAPDRLEDAAAVKRRFEQAVAGRLRPIRGLGKKWPLAVGALAVAASAGVIAWSSTKSTRKESAPTGQSGAEFAAIRGRAVELLSVSRPIWTTDQPIHCLDPMNGGRSVRLIAGVPRTALELDLTTGKATPSKLSPDAFQVGCPQVSPDGRRLLYVREDAKQKQIMLSGSPDGGDASVVTEGDSPTWLPSGEEFVYSFDGRRTAAFSLPKTRLLFPDSPPFEKSLRDIAVSASGDEVAFLFLDGRRQASIDRYAYPAMTLMKQVRLGRLAGTVQFDGNRKSLQVAVSDPDYAALAEVTADGSLNRFVNRDGANVLNAFRSPFGIAFLTTRIDRRAQITFDDKLERELAYYGMARPAVSQQGDVLFENRLSDGRFVIALQRRTDATAIDATQGPADAYPTFAPNGDFAFVRLRNNEIVWCQVAGVKTSCKTVTVDPLGPRSTAISPDGKLIAYHTSHGPNSRLRIVKKDGGPFHDAGIYRGGCGLTWSSNTALWIFQTQTSQWIEVDAQTGKPTGVQRPPEKRGRTCDELFNSLMTSAGRFELRTQQKGSVEIRLAEAL